MRRVREECAAALPVQTGLGREAAFMTTLSEYHAEQMKDPEYAAEYERLQP